MHSTLQNHLLKDLDLFPTKIDQSLQYQQDHDGALVGLNGSYVDDLLRAGTPSFRDHTKFETSGDEDPPLTFAGFHIEKSDDTPVSIDQLFYLKKLEELPPGADFFVF